MIFEIQHKVLVFALAEDEIDPNVAGLCANKMMAKYQRPVCVLRKTSDGDFIGSMRGYNKTGIESFKKIAEMSTSCNWCRGHENAAGISISDKDSFIKDMDEILKDIKTEIVYYIDYIWDSDCIESTFRKESAECCWGRRWRHLYCLEIFQRLQNL